ncbi:MAG: hypothetical protein JNJ88_18935 [Planctomycetes bacterium]|nr:hypothetical protein [Planctomycetota bacterium]
MRRIIPTGMFAVALTGAAFSLAAEDLSTLLVLTPGRCAMYDGTLTRSIDGKPAAQTRFVASFAVLERAADGSVQILERLRRADSGKLGNEKLTKENSEASLLALAPALRSTRTAPVEEHRSGADAVGGMLKFAPMPHGSAPRTAGVTVEAGQVILPNGEAFDATLQWTAVAADGLLRLEATPKLLPATRSGGSDSLEAYHESYVIDPTLGAVKSYEISWKMKHARGCEYSALAEEVKITGVLNRAFELGSDELKALRAENGLESATDPTAPLDYTDFERNKKKEKELSLPGIRGVGACAAPL